MIVERNLAPVWLQKGPDKNTPNAANDCFWAAGIDFATPNLQGFHPLFLGFRFTPSFAANWDCSELYLRVSKGGFGGGGGNPNN